MGPSFPVRIYKDAACVSQMRPRDASTSPNLLWGIVCEESVAQLSERFERDGRIDNLVGIDSLVVFVFPVEHG